MEKFPSSEPIESAANTEKTYEQVSQEDIHKGAKLYITSKARPGEFAEVEVMSDIQQTNDVTPREYVRVKAVDGNLDTDVEIKDLLK
jgi:hypothetical protein